MIIANEVLGVEKVDEDQKKSAQKMEACAES